MKAGSREARSRKLGSLMENRKEKTTLAETDKIQR